MDKESTGIAQIKRYSELLKALDAAYDFTGNWMCNGCEHGVKPASSCPNEGCEDAELHRRWNELMGSRSDA